VGAHDFAGKILGAHRGLAQGIELLSLLVEILHHFALIERGFVEQALECVSFVSAFFGESLVCRLLFGKLQRHPIALASRGLKGFAQVSHLPLDLLDRVLMRFGAFGELDPQLIALGRGLLQPVSQVLKMGSTLLEELFEVLLRGEIALDRLELARGFVRSRRSALAVWRLSRVMR
jgi:hypothetical protein